MAFMAVPTGSSGCECQLVCHLFRGVLAACPRSVPRFFILTFLVGFLALINYRGVDIGTKVNNFFTIAKLLPLLAVVIVGSIYLFRAHHSSSVPLMASTPTTPGSWLKTILLLVFAYGGFETALTPMGEAKDPRRDTVLSLFTALVICTLLYTLIQ
jgi:APA family basic amino acid/polyamine antiporter